MNSKVLNEVWTRVIVPGIDIDALWRDYSADIYATVELYVGDTWTFCAFDKVTGGRLSKLDGHLRASEACKAGDDWWQEWQLAKEVQYE